MPTKPPEGTKGIGGSSESPSPTVCPKCGYDSDAQAVFERVMRRMEKQKELAKVYAVERMTQQHPDLKPFFSLLTVRLLFSAIALSYLFYWARAQGWIP